MIIQQKTQSQWPREKPKLGPNESSFVNGAVPRPAKKWWLVLIYLLKWWCCAMQTVNVHQRVATKKYSDLAV
jgi:hypothetical protein